MCELDFIGMGTVYHMSLYMIQSMYNSRNNIFNAEHKVLLCRLHMMCTMNVISSTFCKAKATPLRVKYDVYHEVWSYQITRHIVLARAHTILMVIVI